MVTSVGVRRILAHRGRRSKFVAYLIPNVPFCRVKTAKDLVAVVALRQLKLEVDGSNVFPERAQLYHSRGLAATLPCANIQGDYSPFVGVDSGSA